MQELLGGWGLLGAWRAGGLHKARETRCGQAPAPVPDGSSSIIISTRVTGFEAILACAGIWARIACRTAHGGSLRPWCARIAAAKALQLLNKP